MIFHDYPYTNFHELNLDWILRIIKELDQEVDNFVAFNKITFAGAWDGSAYPKWTIVDDGSGNGYLSIKAVPANVPLSNADYWQPVSQYSALYNAFDARITALEGRADSAEAAIAELLQRQNRVYLCISDSYGTDSPSVDRLSWCTQFASILDLTAGVNYFKYYTPGAGFAHNGGQPGSSDGKNFCDVLNNAIADMTSDQMESVTDIIIGGGVNDWDGTDADTSIGINNFQAIAAQYFPNAKIYMICCGWAKRADIRYQTILRYAVDYATGTGNGWAVNSKAYQALQNKAAFVSDGVHPTAAGSLAIAREIINTLAGVSINSNSVSPVNITIGGSARGRAYVSDNIVHAYFNTFSPGALPDLGAGASIDAVEISCPYIFGGGDISEEFPAQLNMKIGTTWESKRVSVFFRYDQREDKTYLCIHNNAEIIPAGGFGSYTGITDSYLAIQKVELSPYC